MSSRSTAADIANETMARIRQRQGIEKPSTKPRTAPVRKAAAAPAVKLKAAPKPKAPKDYPLCACGCKEHTRGGIYRPGHDSKHRSAQAGPKVMPLCLCGCKEQTKGGRYRPGHDAKHHSALRAAEKAQAEQTKAKRKAKPRVRFSHKGAATAAQTQQAA